MNTVPLAACLAACLAAGLPFGSAQAASPRELARAQIDADYPRLFALYQHLHACPELSFHETRTAARLAEELRQAGGQVTPGVGANGVVAVFQNGAGPTVLVRADLDALPVKEQTGLPYASTVTARDDTGAEVSVMHACGHDLHLTSLVGTARVLARLKDYWRGTLVFIGQPAEERGGGARAMLADGLYRRFPRPDFCLALHDNAEMPAGSIGYVEGYALANVDMVELTIRGVGGHGAYPHMTRDPIVLAAETVLALQTIVSRELPPGEPAVVTVGSIHGGTKANVIPDEVRLQLTLRSYSPEVRRQIIGAIQRLARGLAAAAGVPEDRMPILRVPEDYTPATFNDPALTQRLAAAWRTWLGAERVLRAKPVMAGEDFGEYGLTEPKVPICLFWVGAVAPEAMTQHEKTGQPLPSLHSPRFAPLPEPTLKTAITAMAAGVLELLALK